MRYRKTIKSVEYSFADDSGLERSYVRQPSLVDSFYQIKNVCPESGKESIQFTNPLYMLFNQQRIDRLGPEAIRQWLDSLDRASSSSRNELKDKLSDDDLLQMVKSRHIQHPCELERYLQALNERADYFNSEVARIVAEEKDKQHTEQVDSVDVVSKPDVS